MTRGAPLCEEKKHSDADLTAVNPPSPHISSCCTVATLWSCVGGKTHYTFKVRPGAVLQLATGLKICKAC